MSSSFHICNIEVTVFTKLTSFSFLSLQVRSHMSRSRFDARLRARGERLAGDLEGLPFDHLPRSLTYLPSCRTPFSPCIIS